MCQHKLMTRGRMRTLPSCSLLVQEYHAAADEQRRNSKPGLMTGLFNTLDEPTDTDPNVEQLQNLSLSLPAPAPSQEVAFSQLLYRACPLQIGHFFPTCTLCLRM